MVVEKFLIKQDTYFDPQKIGEVQISQSALKYFFDKRECKVRWYRQYALGERGDPTESMLRGLVFEDHVIGGTRDGDKPEFKKTLKGGYYKKDQDVLDMAKGAKFYLEKIGLKVTEVQPEWVFNDIVAHPDFLGEFHNSQHFEVYDDPLIIGDIKWTDTKITDRWHGWDNFAQRPDLHIQPVHYVWTYYQVYDKILPFYYFIFGQSGWIRFYSVRIQQDTLLAHINSIAMFREKMKTFFPEPANDFNKCRACIFQDTCLVKAKEPKVEDQII